jgi:hypothetical protein
VAAKPSASATWLGRGIWAKPSSRWTPRWTWAFEADPLAATMRFTSAGASGITAT